MLLISTSAPSSRQVRDGIIPAHGSKKLIDPAEADEARRTKLDHTLNKGQVVPISAARIYSRIPGGGKPGPGYRHFLSRRDVAYFEQLTAREETCTLQQGFSGSSLVETRPEAERGAGQPGVRAYAALQGLISMGLQLNKRTADVAARRAMSVEEKSVPRARRQVIHSSYMDR